MARRVDYTVGILVLWCVSSTALNIPSPSSVPEKFEEPLYTTRRTSKVFFDLPAPNSKLPLPVVNFEVWSTTTMPPESTTTTTTTTTSTTTRRSLFSEQPHYRLNGSNGQACILLQVDALITVQYRTKLGEEQEKSIYVPSDATVTGNCDNENTVTMSLKWETFLLSWSFAKTPGGERWYVEKIELIYSSNDPHFEHIDQTLQGKTIRLSTGQKHSAMLFPTPVGKSYSCTQETEIPLTDGKNHGSVILRDMKLQPFKFKNNEFAAEFSCTSLSARGFRDETAPVAVGSTLAAAVLLTITGYAAYRYFKVKKVKYDTME
ncbi:lysosome-associated membrane glycoprotein 5 [Ptiloglossa arizonensis]|uniref:lysosome-associated membrane glycoprotein 5 n=1 Tax=Ptiloglossa arizonensis TaxID=3350558 RepID=UPI003F9F8E97